MNIKRTFKSAFAKIEPGEGFQTRTAERLQQERLSQKKPVAPAGGRRAWLLTTLKFCANVLVVLLIVHLTGIGSSLLPAGTGGTTAETTTTETTAAQTSLSTTGLTTTPTAIAIDDVVVSRNYKQGEIVDRMAPRPGDIVINLGVQRALEEPANQEKRFYIELMIIPSENEIARFDQYVYNGRTIAEWRVLVDLANGTYPYSEYNGDHGGNVTVEAWQQKQTEAKTLDAQTNLERATDEYQATMTPANHQKALAILQAEAARLIGLGYQVFLRPIKAEGQGLPYDDYPLLCGLLTADQLRHFPGLTEYGYAIDWVHDENGIANWDG